jgi:hypothetical protein
MEQKTGLRTGVRAVFEPPPLASTIESGPQVIHPGMDLAATLTTVATAVEIGVHLFCLPRVTVGFAYFHTLGGNCSITRGDYAWAAAVVAMRVGRKGMRPVWAMRSLR